LFSPTPAWRHGTLSVTLHHSGGILQYN
jgi:hypothetical protein